MLLYVVLWMQIQQQWLREMAVYKESPAEVVA